MRKEPQEKTLAERNDVGVGYNFNEQPWLQLMCCVPVSSHEVVTYFGVERSRQGEGPKEANWESRVDKKIIRTR